MANRRTAKQIVEESMPKVEVMPPMRSPLSDEAVEKLPSGASIDQLRKKFLGAGSAEDAAGSSRTIANSSDVDELRRRFLGESHQVENINADDVTADDDVEIVRVQARSEADDATTGPGVRAVIVSKSQDKIIGKQG